MKDHYLYACKWSWKDTEGERDKYSVGQEDREVFECVSISGKDAVRQLCVSVCVCVCVCVFINLPTMEGWTDSQVSQVSGLSSAAKIRIQVRLGDGQRGVGGNMKYFVR